MFLFYCTDIRRVQMASILHAPSRSILKSESEAAAYVLMRHYDDTVSPNFLWREVRSHLLVLVSPHHKRKAINFVLGMKMKQSVLLLSLQYLSRVSIASPAQRPPCSSLCVGLPLVEFF